MAEHGKNTNYTLTPDECAAIQELKAEIAAAKELVYETNVRSEQVRRSAQQAMQQAEAATYEAVAALRAAEERFAGARNLLTRVHGLSKIEV